MRSNFQKVPYKASIGILIPMEAFAFRESSCFRARTPRKSLHKDRGGRKPFETRFVFVTALVLAVRSIDVFYRLAYLFSASVGWKALSASDPRVLDL